MSLAFGEVSIDSYINFACIDITTVNLGCHPKCSSCCKLQVLFLNLHAVHTLVQNLYGHV